MTAALQKAFAEAAKLPDIEQDQLASRLLAELAAEEAFDEAITATGDKLAGLAAAALAEHHAGRSKPFDFGQS